MIFNQVINKKQSSKTTLFIVFESVKSDILFENENMEI